MMVIVAIISATALIIKAQGVSFDLNKETKQLYSENRRDDALVLVKTFKGITESGNDELAKMEKQLEYGTVEKFKSALWKGRIETGILMLTSERSEKSKLGNSVELAKAEVEQLYPTISMPVTIALFDLGTPDLPDENSVKGGEADGVSVPAVKTIEEYTEEDWENFEPFP
jgi:hypothetical protein